MDSEQQQDESIIEGPKIRHIDLSSNKFEANGKTYYIQSDLSVSRYVEYLKLSTEVQFDTSFEGMYSTLNKIWKASSSGNDILHAIQVCRELSYNQINAVVNFVKHDYPIILKFCALFINHQEEDTGLYDERVIEEKINDWKQSGIAIDDFFLLAANFNPTFKAQLKDSLQAKQEKETTEKPPMNQAMKAFDSITKNSNSSSKTRPRTNR